MKHLMITYASAQEGIMFDIQQNCISLNGYLDKIDRPRDVKDFVRNNRTGKLPDPPADYDPYTPDKACERRCGELL